MHGARKQAWRTQAAWANMHGARKHAWRTQAAWANNRHTDYLVNHVTLANMGIFPRYKNVSQNFFFYSNWSRRACVRHSWWRTKRSWPLFSPTFFFFLFLSSFYAFCFSPTSGYLPCVKICFPQYFGITRRYMQKKYIYF